MNKKKKVSSACKDQSVTIFLEKGEAVLLVSRAVYSKEAVEISAQIISSQCDVFLSETKRRFEVTLKAKKKDLGEELLVSLAGNFFNELLNQEYRFLVGNFNRNISNLIVTQSLFSARGGEDRAAVCAAEKTPEFKAEVEELIKKAKEEVARTMPPKILPAGFPLSAPPEA